MKKGFTLIEVILGIFLISLIAMVFIPVVSFSFKNIVHSQEFTKTLFADQRYVENEMEAWQEIEPTDDLSTTGTIEVFGNDIKGHEIALATPTSGEVNIFLPQRVIPNDLPVIDGSPEVIVKQGGAAMPSQPDNINLFDNTKTLFVYEVDMTDDTKANFLMNIYRWYLTPETNITNVPSNDTDDYTVLKEWNEARTPVSLAESILLNFIPNIKIGYNTIDFASLQTDMGFTEEEMINRFGNRFIQYGVTPFSESARIGLERLSNVIYIQAPRIEILDAEFITGENRLKIVFNNNVLDTFSLDRFELDSSLGSIIAVIRDDSDLDTVLVEYENAVDQTVDLAGNYLHRGAVTDEDYGAISIWHNDVLEGEFIIKPE